jgi:Eukaryotic aspartyl protease
MQISFFLSHSQDSSHFIFGGYDESLIKAGEEIQWYDLTGKNWWQVEIQDIIVENESIYSDKTSKAIIDSGTSLITVPYEDFQKLNKLYNSQFLVNYDYVCFEEYHICVFAGKCSGWWNRLEPIKLQFSGDKVLTVPPEDYLTDVEVEVEQNGKLVK